MQDHGPLSASRNDLMPRHVALSRWREDASEAQRARVLVELVSLPALIPEHQRVIAQVITPIRAERAFMQYEVD